MEQKELRDKLLRDSMEIWGDYNMEDEKESLTTKHRTYLFYSQKFEYHITNEDETYDRCSAVYSKLKESGIFEEEELKQPLVYRISYYNLLRVHDFEYIKKMINSQNRYKTHIDNRTYAGKYTSRIAELAAGSVIEAVNYLQNSELNFVSAFCLIRPPGHHAYRNCAEGYCFYNNAALGATYAIEQFEVERVCILDWDVHHGDGTQDIFYDSK